MLFISLKALRILLLDSLFNSSIAFSNNLIPYTIGVVFRSYDGFYSGRDNGCNDIFITGIQGDDIQVIQSTDLSIYNAITITKNVSKKFFKIWYLI